MPAYDTDFAEWNVSRSVPEWIGKHDDQKVPPRVRLRVFDRYEGRCYLTGREIRPGEKWELEHKIPLILGGEHRESNMAPALVDPHKEKTKAEQAIKSKIAKTRKKHLGISAPKQKIPGRGFPKTDKPERQTKPTLPRRSLYKEIDV